MTRNSAYRESGGTVLFFWEDFMAEFFSSRKIFLNYPWQISGVYRERQSFAVSKNCSVEAYSCSPIGRILSFGAFSYCRTTGIAPDFRLGRYCSVAHNVSISEQEHPLDRFTTHPFTTHANMARLAAEEFGKERRTWHHEFLKPPPDIGHDVWIGDGAMIKRGLSIGHGAVIGARALVTKDVPPYAIVGGNPARVIRYRFPDRVIEQMLELNWWDYVFTDLPERDPKDVFGFVQKMRELIEEKSILKFKPAKFAVAQELMAFCDRR